MKSPVLALHEQLLATGATVAVAESLTSGHLQTLLSMYGGASAHFRGGVTAYHIDIKVDLLGVDREHAERVDCVSKKVAEQMVAGVQRLFGTDLALSTTGFATSPGEGIKPHCWVGVRIGEAVHATFLEADIRMARVQVQEHFAQMAAGFLLHCWALEQTYERR